MKLSNFNRCVLLIVFLCVVAALAACGRTPGVQVSSTSNPQIEVTMLFEKEGHKVWRFQDQGNYVYYVTPAGLTSRTEYCGKNCYRPFMVSTQEALP